MLAPHILAGAPDARVMSSSRRWQSAKRPPSAARPRNAWTLASLAVVFGPDDEAAPRAFDRVVRDTDVRDGVPCEALARAFELTRDDFGEEPLVAAMAHSVTRRPLVGRRRCADRTGDWITARQAVLS